MLSTQMLITQMKSIKHSPFSHLKTRPKTAIFLIFWAKNALFSTYPKLRWTHAIMRELIAIKVFSTCPKLRWANAGAL